MLQVFVASPEGLTPASDPKGALASGTFVWADICADADSEAMREGERAIEAALGVDVPTPLERRAFEESARLFEEADALFLTATLMGQRSEGAFVADAVTFILSQGRLVTVRTIRPRAFTIGEGRSSARIKDAQDGGGVMIALLEGVVERIADVLKENNNEANALSARVLVLNERSDHRAVLMQLGKQGALIALCLESLVSLHRMSIYTETVCHRHGLVAERFTTFGRDVRELERQAEALQHHVAFLMQAALGLVGAAQNEVLRTVALATIAFAPATLIASFFGMNFEWIHWYAEPWGPWAAGAMMVAGPASLFALARWLRWF